MTAPTIEQDTRPAGRPTVDILDVDHYVCRHRCDDNTAICGTDVADVPWSPVVKLCPMCAVVAAAAVCPTCGRPL